MTSAPTFITPPTGAYRVLVWTGAKVEELAERPETEEGRAAALALFNGARFPAAFCHGPTVVKRNGRGDAHSAAFRAFLGAAPAPTPRRVAAAKPARLVEMPAREPTRPVEEPADPRELARAATNRPAVPESSPAPRPVESPAAPVALPKPAEEPMPAEKPANKLCTNCHRRPPATVTKRTRAGHAEWCGKCRKTHWKPASEATTAPSKKARAPKPARKVAASAPSTPAPSKRAAAPAAGALDESLALVESHATLIRRLGGVEAATRLAALVEAHGGDAVVRAVERVLAIGGAS